MGYYFMEKPFFGKKALVVGGTGGIGRAVSLGLAKMGAELAVHGGSSKENLDNTLKEIRKNGGTAEGFLLAINGPQAAGEILSFSPKPDILVCAWGPFKQGRLDSLDKEFWKYMTESNLVFPGILVSHVLKGMMERNWGRILLFGGTNTDTIRGFTSTSAYSAAKTALGVIAKSVAKTAGTEITCNVLCPGLTDTEYTTEELRLYNQEKSPAGRALTVQQLASAALAILKAPCINGAVLPADGGVVV